MKSELQQIQQRLDAQAQQIQAVTVENRWLKRFLVPAGIGSLLGIGGLLWGTDVSVPNAFTSGTLISASQINTNFATIYNFANELNQSIAPVGTIVPSMLNETQFVAQAGDPAVFDATVSKWALADGKSVGGSTYASVVSASNVPDLRGMFLRGLNEGRNDGKQDPDGGSRAVGSYQADEVKTHNHNDGSYDRLGIVNGVQTNDGFVDDSAGEVNMFFTGQLQNYGGNETRPKNVAVYYYIRIN